MELKEAMPSAPRKPCRKQGCNKLGTEAYCEEHRLQRRSEVKRLRNAYDKERGTRTERGYDSRWLRASTLFRKSNPLCVMCEKEGVYKVGDCVDHITPHRDNEELFWDVNNWQVLCNRHHGYKTAKEDGGFGNVIRK